MQCAVLNIKIIVCNSELCVFLCIFHTSSDLHVVCTDIGCKLPVISALRHHKLQNILCSAMT